jgi:hypothetical protein
MSQIRIIVSQGSQGTATAAKGEEPKYELRGTKYEQISILLRTSYLVIRTCYNTISCWLTCFFPAFKIV